MGLDVGKGLKELYAFRPQKAPKWEHRKSVRCCRSRCGSRSRSTSPWALSTQGAQHVVKTGIRP